jgi:hypothetical protein
MATLLALFTLSFGESPPQAGERNEWDAARGWTGAAKKQRLFAA